jgi:hypothetical protein
MRDIKALLELLLDRIRNGIARGLCYELTTLLEDAKISDDEFLLLDSYFRKNLPVSIYGSDGKTINTSYALYCWKIGEHKPRIEWLETQIKTLD